MLIAWIIALVLILINALYVAAEFATVAARTVNVQRLAAAGHPVAALLLPILEEPKKLDEYIATCQIGITFSSLLLGVAWSQALVSYARLDAQTAASVATIAILSVFTVLQILLGELLPKSVALQYAERSALLFYWPLRVSSFVLRPFIWLLNGSGNFVLNLFAIPPSSHKHVHSLEEIELLLAESRDGGLLEADEHRRLHQALELSEKTASQLMTPRTKISAVNKQITVQKCYQLALQSPYSRMLVYGESIDDVLGIVNVKSVIEARFRQLDNSIEDLVRPVPMVPENLALGRLITLLKSRQSHVAIVMDEHGATLGIVTVGDILTDLIEDVETDEFKQPETFEVLEKGRIRLPGSYKLHRSSKFLGQMPASDADTVNGLILEILERLPVPGDLIELHDVILEVESVEHNAATSIIVTRKARE
jgi:putative hemolysin